MSIDIELRPKVFKGMRAYLPAVKTWITYLEETDKTFKGQRLWNALIDKTDKEDAVRMPNESNKILLIGEPSCPEDPKNKDWAWREQDKFYFLSDATWSFRTVKGVGLDRIVCNEKQGKLYLWSSVETYTRGALHVPKETNITVATTVSSWNSICKICNSPAYTGLLTMECSNKECNS